MYEQNNIQQLRHKLTKFHRHVTLNKGGSKSKVSQFLVWPPAALGTAVHLLFMEFTRFASYCCEMLPHSSNKASASSQTFSIQQVPDVLNGMEIQALRWPWQNTDIPVFQEITNRMSSVAVMLEGHVRMSLQEGYHMRQEDVFPVTHSIEIACNDNKLSPMML